MRLKKPLITEDKLENIQRDKRPESKVNHIGVEIECISKSSRFTMEQYFLVNNLDKFVTVKDDCSIRTNATYHNRYEIAVIAPQSKFSFILKKVCAILKETQCTVNRSCGLHIHVDMRNREYERTYLNLVHMQPLLYSIQPESRRRSGFCDASYTTDVDFSGDRDGINALAMQRHKTIEIRIHSGTINYKKIVNWINLLLLIVQTRKTITEPQFNFNTIVKEFKLTKSLANYIKLRLKKFNVNPNSLIDIWNY